MNAKREKNVDRMLDICEKLSNNEKDSWRLNKYIPKIGSIIEELKNYSNSKLINNYDSRLSNIKTATNYSDNPIIRNGTTSKIENDEQILKEMYQTYESTYFHNLRKDLINADGVRKRNVDGGDNLSQAMKYYGDYQEKIAEDMLSLTRNLKEQTEAANKIIKRDNEILTKSSQVTDKNTNALNKEAEKLNEHSRKAWKCWMWMMIVFVIVIFISMVFFMKLMKKKTV